MLKTTEIYFHAVLGARKYKTKMSVHCISGEDLLLALLMATFSLCPNIPGYTC
jgi:hypothetical protein